MQTIHYVTTNKGKVEILNNIIKDIETKIKFEILDYDYPEDKSDDTVETVALEGAEYCANKFNKEVIVTDTGLFIRPLNGFPGVNTAFTLKRIGKEGIIKLMEDMDKREAEVKVALAYCRPNYKPELFLTVVKGSISTEIRGTLGFGFDPVFVPEGYAKTFGEDPELRDRLMGYRNSIVKFVEWYDKKV